MKTNYNIPQVDQQLASAIAHKIDMKTKPVGALGMLEAMASKVALLQQSLSPELRQPHIIIFAGDHGVAQQGVSCYPQEVTHQMVLNFLRGGAAINVLARQQGIALKIVDAGVNHDFTITEGLIDKKVNMGTRNFLLEKAMTEDELSMALAHGAAVVDDVARSGCNVVGFGEMGIGNTSGAALIMHKLTAVPLPDCVGRGTGLDDAGLQRKIEVLTQASARHHTGNNPLSVLQCFGGYEIAQICGGMLRAAERGMLILLDGFIATSAYLVASALYPFIADYTILCHQSAEKGHSMMAKHIKLAPVLQLNLRLGEGTGCAIAYPVIASAVAFFNEMASFDEAEVSQAL